MITAENIFDNFKSTMSGLEKGLQVMHITTPTDQLYCCQDDEEIEAVLLRSDLKPFDQILSNTGRVSLALSNWACLVCLYRRTT